MNVFVYTGISSFILRLSLGLIVVLGYKKSLFLNISNDECNILGLLDVKHYNRCIKAHKLMQRGNEAATLGKIRKMD